ncbi:MAG: cation:proton antiporter [Gammaproteobacteria bacterium]|nr:cation:proton antiporter [Gammaproteobacteria bacterium]
MIYAIFIAAAFFATLVTQPLRMPALVGFLLVGMALHQYGVETPILLEQVGDLGVTVLLFTIGLKLKLRQLARPVVWGTTLIHAGLWMLLMFGVLWLLSDHPLIGDMSISGWWTLAFALSFSSTVFAMSMMERKGEAYSFYGRLSIGILVMQDVLAVIYLSSASGHPPSAWALALPLLYFTRPLLYALLNRAGHNELLIIGGLALALLPGAALFTELGMKADLGALVIGMLLAGHPKAEELARTLFNLKELLLVAFFLTIGMNTALDLQSITLAFALVLLLPIKMLLFTFISLLFRTRARTSFNSGLVLATYSEFGLIVGAVAVNYGYIDRPVLALLAITIAFSFIMAAPLNMLSARLHDDLAPFLQRWQRRRILLDDAPITVTNARFIILGMGRIGSGVYDRLSASWPGKVLGVDADEERVAEHQAKGRWVLAGDATDAEFWDRLNHNDSTQLVFLAMPYHRGNEYAASQLVQRGFRGKVAAIATYEDDAAALRQMGVDVVFNIYREAGSGFAEHALAMTALVNNSGQPLHSSGSESTSTTR